MLAFAVLRRGNALPFAKTIGEIIGVVESDLKGDLRDGKAVVTQQFFCKFDAHPVYILHDAHPFFCIKIMAQIRFAVMQAAADFVQRQWIGKVIGEIHLQGVQKRIGRRNFSFFFGKYGYVKEFAHFLQRQYERPQPFKFGQGAVRRCFEQKGERGIRHAVPIANAAHAPVRLVRFLAVPAHADKAEIGFPMHDAKNILPHAGMANSVKMIRMQAFFAY